uniref:Uncharacterized protein n=1 Tax=Acrobeloides nanus TaxID=290746 RepID=A0A914DGI0_9BILA
MASSVKEEYNSGYFMPIKYFAPINDILTGTLSILGNIILLN